MSTVIDLAILLITLGIMYALMSEGFWGATLMLFNVLFSGLIAFNFYEPLADLLIKNVPDLASFADVICLMTLLLVSLILLRIMTAVLGKRQIRFPSIVSNLGRILVGLVAAALTVGILLCSFATAPVHKKLFGTISADDKPPLGLSLNHRWLFVVRNASEHAFARYASGNDPKASGEARVFDPDGTWLEIHEKARPYASEEENAATPPAK